MKLIYFNKTKEFLESKINILIILFITLICYQFDFIYLAKLLLPIIIILLLITKSKFNCIIALFMLNLASTHDEEIVRDNRIIFVFLIVLYVCVGLLFFKDLIINRKDIFNKLKKNYIFYSMILMIMVMFISLINTPTMSSSLMAISDYGVCLGLYVLGVLYLDRDKKTSNIILFSIIAACLLICVQYSLTLFKALYDNENIKELIKEKELKLGYIHPNHSAIVLNIGLLICFYSIIVNKEIKFKITYLLISLILFFTQFLIISRGAYISLAFSCLVLIALLFLLKKNNLNKTMIFQLLCCGLIIVTISLLALRITNNYYSFKHMITHDGLNDNGRFVIYELAWDNFKLHPIIGTGVHSAHYYIEPRFPDFPVYNYHNYILQVLSCTGIIGLVAFIIYIIVISINILKNKNTLLLTVPIFSYMLVHGLLDTTFFNIKIESIFLIILSNNISKNIMVNHNNESFI